MTKFIIALVIIAPIAMLLAVAKGVDDATKEFIKDQDEE